MNVPTKIEIPFPFPGMVGKQKFVQYPFFVDGDAQPFKAFWGYDVMVASHQDDFCRRFFDPILEQLPFFVEMGMEQVTQKTNLEGLKMAHNFVKLHEIFLCCTLGHGRPEFSKMGYLAQMHIADKQ